MSEARDGTRRATLRAVRLHLPTCTHDDSEDQCDDGEEEQRLSPPSLSLALHIFSPSWSSRESEGGGHHHRRRGKSEERHVHLVHPKVPGFSFMECGGSGLLTHIPFLYNQFKSINCVESHHISERPIGVHVANTIDRMRPEDVGLSPDMVFFGNRDVPGEVFDGTLLLAAECGHPLAKPPRHDSVQQTTQQIDARKSRVLFRLPFWLKKSSKSYKLQFQGNLSATCDQGCYKSLHHNNLLCLGAAVMGYIMFGETTESQFTLNMPPNLMSSKIAV